MKTRVLPFFGISLLCAVLAPLSRAQNGTGLDMFLRLDDVKGSATADGFKDQMPVLNFFYSITNVGGAIAVPVGRAFAGDLVITKPIDKATPVLAQAAAAGTQFKTAVLTVRKPVLGEQRVYYTVTLTGVHVDGVSQAASATAPVAGGLPYPYGGPDAPAIETIALGYVSIQWTANLDNVKAGYDFSTNKKADVSTNAPRHELEAAIPGKGLASASPAAQLK